MPGARLQVTRAPRVPMGIRRPRHNGYLFGQWRRELHPFMVAPVRPGERLERVSLQGESWFMSMVQLPNAPLTYYEVGLWYLPLSILNHWMTDLFTFSPREIASTGGSWNPGTSLPLTDDVEGDQGLQSVGLQTVDRTWAGEGSAPNGYLPVASFGTHKVAADFYDRGADMPDADVADTPPSLPFWIRGAAHESFLAGDADLGVDPSVTTDLESLVESLYILSKTDITYAEYLAAHGRNFRDAGGIAMPLLVRQGVLTGWNPQFAGGVRADTVPTGPEGTFEEETINSYVSTKFGTAVTTDTDDGMVYDNRPVGPLYHRWNQRRNRNLVFEEPGIILGTGVWFDDREDSDQETNGHVFDVTRMVSSGHWGDRSRGDIDEDDFLSVQTAEDIGGTGSTERVYNHLNTFLHGDYYRFHGTHVNAESHDPFEYRGVGGVIIPKASRNFNMSTSITSKFSVDLSIRSDLVG